jgi:hypothetical protein
MLLSYILSFLFVFFFRFIYQFIVFYRPFYVYSIPPLGQGFWARDRKVNFVRPAYLSFKSCVTLYDEK